ncbi:MAG: Spx/MgsR family RNA polymerase-binding regulatory protein [Acidobacteria bacterium]|nr:Spx/MgsR family RNA polymerase-binding regulatory protein [Acidobacteriota bacterium]
MTKKLILWQKPTCTTCRKAVDHLTAHGFELEKHDLAKERPSRELLGKLIDEQGLETVFNARSRAAKERGIDVAKLTKSKAIDLILDEPNLMKRPLVLAGDDAVFGFDPDAYGRLDAKKK